VNTPKMREVLALLRREMAMGVTAQRLAVLTADAFEAVLDDEPSQSRVGSVRLVRHTEALMREMAVWLLEDLELARESRGTREQQLVVITGALRTFARRLTIST
jgi:hypothetical protein